MKFFLSTHFTFFFFFFSFSCVITRRGWKSDTCAPFFSSEKQRIETRDKMTSQLLTHKRVNETRANWLEVWAKLKNFTFFPLLYLERTFFFFLQLRSLIFDVTCLHLHWKIKLHLKGFTFDHLSMDEFTDYFFSTKLEQITIDRDTEIEMMHSFHLYKCTKLLKQCTRNFFSSSNYFDSFAVPDSSEKIINYFFLLLISFHLIETTIKHSIETIIFSDAMRIIK